jgi:hypothetical protein
MNSEALKMAWLMMWNTPATAARGVPMPNRVVIEAQVADGGIGQQTLQVVLEQSDEGADEQGGQADAAHQMGPLPGAGQGREQPRQQEHPGFHHGGRMQVGGNRRRRRHGVGQPEVERELGRLGERPQQDQDQGGQIEGMGADQVARGQNLRQFVTAGDFPQQQDAPQQGQPAHAGYRQGHAGAVAGFLAFLPVADEQEGTQAGQLPEDQHLDQVFRQHHAQHGTHEQEQIGVKAAQAVPLRQVIAGIDDDQQADAQDQAGEHQAQAVQAEGEVQSGGGHPGQALHQR